MSKDWAEELLKIAENDNKNFDQSLTTRVKDEEERISALFYSGAAGETRTLNPLPEPASKAGVYTNSTTAANLNVAVDYFICGRFSTN